MRYTAVIIDDEPGVCSLLMKLGNWEELSIEVVGVCHDGEDALQLLKKYRPDVAITDIRMPGLDGVELIEQASHFSRNTRFIILSGYGLFEYAQKAMRYGVKHYLLKPIDGEHLNQILTEVCSSLNDETSSSDTFPEDIRQQDCLELKREWLANLMSDRGKRYGRERVNRMFRTEFAEGKYYVFALCCDNSKLHNENSAFYYKALFLLREKFDSFGGGELIPNEQGLFYLLCDTVRERVWEEGKIKNALLEISHKLQLMYDLFGTFECKFAWNGTAGSFDELPSTMQETVRLLQCRVLAKDCKILTPKECSNFLEGESDERISKELDNLQIYFETYLRDKISEWFQHVQESFEDGLWKLKDISRIRDMIAENTRQIKQSVLPADKDEEILNELEQKLQYTFHLKDFFGLAGSYCQTWLALLEDYKMDLELKPVRRAKEYIALHLSEQISLEETAAYVHYSPAYLSTLFRRETGMNFKDYLQKERIEKAKEYLKNTRESIVKISEMVGFTSDKYFRKVFKQEVGVRAKEYRDLYQ